MQTIKISKIAFGSLSTTIGDATLGYTEGVSFRAREVDGIYVDNPPVLSKDYSSVIWKYYPDTDNYMLTHVQGLHVTDNSMARFFPYRGAYEVSRSEMNRTGLSVASVLDSMPRIKQFGAPEKWDTATSLHSHVRLGNPLESECLAETIERAIDFGTRLYISMPAAGRNLRENNVFHSSEWNTLIEAVDLLPQDIRRYVSFAFCVDEHYAEQLGDVLVTVYVRESNLVVPQGCTDIKWEVLKTLKRASSAELQAMRTAMSALPGRSEKMLPLAEVFKKVRTYKDIPKYTEQLKKDKRPIESAEDVFALIREYKGRVEDESLLGVVSMLDPIKKKHVIEQLCASEQRDALITAGLETILTDKAAKLGTDADAWYTFLGKLKSDDGLLEKSIKLYMSRIRSWNKRDVSALCKSVVAFEKAHPRKANTDLYRLMVKTLHLEKDIKIKTEPKNPSNNMQENNNNSLVQNPSDQDTSAFDSLYEEIVKEEKRSKTKTQVLIGLCSFIVGAIIAGAVASFTLPMLQQDAQTDVDTTPVDTLNNITLTLNPADSTSVIILMLDSICKARFFAPLDSLDTLQTKELNVKITTELNGTQD